MHHQDEGTGQPVLLLHGLMASSRVFDPLISLAKDRYRFLAPDLPSSGRSKDWAPMDPGVLADRLWEWAQARGVKKAVVVGHSFGGLVALRLAERHPGAVERLVVASTPALGLPFGSKELLQSPLAQLWTAWFDRVPTVRPMVKSYLRFLAGDPLALPDDWVDGYVETLRAPRAWPAMLEASQAVADYRLPVDELKARKLHLQVLWGDRDRLVPLVQGEHLARALKAPFRVLHRTGHLVPQEQPQALLEAIDGRSG